MTIKGLTPAARLRQVLREALDNRDRHRAPVKRYRVEGRNDDGTLRMIAFDAECEQRGAVGKGYGGQIVVGPVSPSFGFRGAAGIAMRRNNVGAATLWIESLEPALLPRGSTTEVAVTGRGFSEDLQILYLANYAGVVPHPYVSVLSIAYVSETSLTLQVAVSMSAPLVVNFDGTPYLFDLAFDDRPGAPRKRLAGCWGIVEAVPDYGNYYAFAALEFEGGASALAMLVEQADMTEERGSEDAFELGDFDNPIVPIARDVAEVVGDGSAAWAVQPATVYCWDVAAATLYSETIAGAGLITPPVYVGGWLYWWTAASVESATTATVKLWRASCDFAGAPTQLLSQVVSFGVNFGSWWDGRILGTTSAVRASMLYFDTNNESVQHISVRANLVGGGFAYESHNDDAVLPQRWGAALDARGVMVDSGVVVGIGSAVDDAPVALWPDSATWNGPWSTVSVSHELDLLTVVSASGFAMRGSPNGTGTPVRFNWGDGFSDYPTILVPIPED